MNRQFPLLLFPIINENASENEFISDMHKNAENLFKFNLKQPIDAYLNEENNEINCLTHKNFSESLIVSKSNLLPWRLPNQLSNIGF